MDAIFEVEIQQAQADGTFVARVLRSAGGGQPSAEFRLDVDQLLGQRGLFEATVLSSAVSARRIMSSMETTVQRVGLVLFTSVFTGEVGAAYRTSAAVAHERGAGLKLVLRLTPELAALPWESLYDPETGGYLSRQEPLVRTVPAGYTSEPLAVDPPLRILGIVSSPRDLQRLDTALERARLENAIRSQLDAGLVELVWLDDVSWSGLHSMLLEQKWHILHFVGHGGFDVATDEGQLALVREDGRADFVSASSLADLLREADPSPRLVVLNSCMSGAVSEDDLFSGTAAALVRSGIHAVAAMQFAVSDGAAVAFARGFYTALARGRRVDEAVRSGRIGILGMGRGTLEWITPVLYLRGDDTRVFDIAPLQVHPGRPRVAPPPEPEQPELEPEPEPEPEPKPEPEPEPEPEPPPETAPESEPATRTERYREASEQDRTEASAERPPTDASGLPDASGATRTPDEARRRRRRWVVGASVGAGVLVATGIAIVSLNPELIAGFSGESPPASSAEPTAPTNLASNLAVPGNIQWTPTGISCDEGMALRVSASGTVQHGPTVDRTSDADGMVDEFRDTNLVAFANHAALIGIVDGVSAPFAVGRLATFECPASGALHLGINDTDFAANTSGFVVTVDDVTGMSDAPPNPATPHDVQVRGRGAVDPENAPTSGWTASGIRCEPGAAYQLRASGIVSYNPADGYEVGPDGRADDPKFIPAWNFPGLEAAPHAGLVAAIDAAPPYQVIGSAAALVCGTDGEIVLAVNDTGPEDNDGSFDVSLTKSASPVDASG